DATSKLLEREVVLERVRDRLSRACAGEGGLLIVEGPSGIGKTRLLAAAREITDDYGMRVLSAQGDRLEQDFAFGVVRQLLEAALLSMDSGKRASLLTGAAALAAEAIGMTQPQTTHEPLTVLLPQADSLFPALHGLYWLCTNL